MFSNVCVFINLVLLGYVYSQGIRIQYGNKHVVGGVRQRGTYSQITCSNACTSNHGCYAIDYDTTDRSCWFHRADSLCQPLSAMIGAVHIRFGECSALSKPVAPTSATPYRNNHVIGGVYLATYKNAYSCVQACIGSCVAVDFDTTDSSCWHHVTPTACSARLSFRSGATHYRMPVCNSNSPAVFNDPGRQSMFSSHIAPQLPLSGPSAISPIIPPPAPSVTCGVPSRSPIGGRIIGGDIARPHAWPWQVALRNRKSKSVRCAGTIIAPTYVLTTAHCVDEDLNAHNWLVYTGAYDLLQFEPTRKSIAVSSVILHQGFDVNTFDNDIAILVLATPVHYNTVASPICLPPIGFEITPGTRCMITGWGVSENGKRPLKQASIPIVGMNTCRRHDWLGAEFTLTPRMICAGYEYGGIDSCQGDSGGPMVCYLSNRWVQIGLTSFGRGCGLPQKPGVYTKVSRYIRWIQQVTHL